MSNFRKEFQLNINDVENIESAIRTVIHNGITLDADSAPDQQTLPKKKVQELNSLLAKLHHQKVFYSQVREPGVPAA